MVTAATTEVLRLSRRLDATHCADFTRVVTPVDRRHYFTRKVVAAESDFVLAPIRDCRSNDETEGNWLEIPDRVRSNWSGTASPGWARKRCHRYDVFLT